MDIRVGGRLVDRAQALKHAERYLNHSDEGWSYPAYDGYEADTARGPLRTADLLAPVLLNVQHMSLQTYYGLVAEIPKLQTVLDKLDPDLKLQEADAEDIALIGSLYEGIDAGRTHGASGTTLSKILHRKRPALIPLYDEHVRRCYQDGDSAIVKQDRKRSWADFMGLMASAIRDDLVSQRDTWAEITQLAREPAITPLRALDIVAWWVGRDTPETSYSTEQ